jgi:hypothetical protein
MLIVHLINQMLIYYLSHIPRPNITMAVNGAYTAVNHKVTVVNGPYFTRFVSTVLRPVF